MFVFQTLCAYEGGKYCWHKDKDFVVAGGLCLSINLSSYIDMPLPDHDSKDVMGNSNENVRVRKFI